MKKDFEKGKRKKWRNRAVSFLTALMMIQISMPMQEYSSWIKSSTLGKLLDFDGFSILTNLFEKAKPNTVMTVSAEETPRRPLDYANWSTLVSNGFNDVNDFIDFSYWYANDSDFAAAHCNDHLIIDFQGSKTLVPFNNETQADYHPLGTEDSPFSGSITFNVTENVYSYTLTSPVPLFDYISDDAVISNSIVKLHLISTTDSEVLFANHVKHDNGTAAWNLVLDSTNTTTYSSVIGSMEENAVVSLNFENASGCAVSATTEESDLCNAGTVCGTMKIGSHLTLSLAESNSAYRVTSSNGHAGGLVGEMQSATLTLKSIPLVSSDTEITSSSKYAGGLVGYVVDSVVEMAKDENDNNIFQVNGTAVAEIPVLGSVKALNAGAGGVFGYYKNTKGTSAAPYEFNLKNFKVGTQARNTQVDRNLHSTDAVVLQSLYSGGVFGVLENEAYFTVKDGNYADGTTIITSLANQYNQASTYGGLIGQYNSAAVDDSLNIEDMYISADSWGGYFVAYGGIIGNIGTTAYVKANNVTSNVWKTDKEKSNDANPLNAYYGGLVGATTPDNGVLLDVANFTAVAHEQTCGGGVVGQLHAGVLRLSGLTDVSATRPKTENTDTDNTNGNNKAKRIATYGQLVGYCGDAFVYALGTGEQAADSVSYGNGWRYCRNATGIDADDIGTWGEVVRQVTYDNSGTATTGNLENAGLITINSDHTVTLTSAQTSIGNTSDFASVALNIMLNQGDNYGLFTFDSGSQRNTLLAGNISLSDDISLSGTGINGFMRDGSTSIASDNTGGVGTFTGTFEGNNHTVTLAVGEAYGVTANGLASALTEGNGAIYRHLYNGLFSVIGNGTTEGTVQNLKIAGSINIRNAGLAGMSAGSIAARSHGSTTLNKVDVSGFTINYYAPVSGYHGSANSGDTVTAWGKHIGGMIGMVDNNNDGNGTVTIDENCIISPTLNFSGYINNWFLAGGAIGQIDSADVDVNISGTVGTKTNMTSVTTSTDESVAGVIGFIGSRGSYSDKVVTLSDLIVNGCSLNSTATGSAGGVLGGTWYNTKSHINGVTVTSATMNYAAANVGAMVYRSTGRMTVDSLTVNGLTLTDSNCITLGMLVNQAYYNTNGLYLDVLKSGYSLKNDSGAITLPTTFTKYDELAAYSAANAANIISGTNVGVVSVNMTGRNGSELLTTTGTYQNQLTSASSSALANAAKYPNDTCRYYYNLDCMDSENGGQNLLLWSVNKYAASNIKSEFTTTLTNTLSGTADMTGLSFYPVPLTASLTIGTLNITFDYGGTYQTEANATLNADSYNRDPANSNNQHYLMQSGLFTSLSAAAATETSNHTLTISGTLTFNGNFLETGNYKGVLISDTMYGSLNTTSGSIVLNGIKPMQSGNAYADGFLLINNIKHSNASYKAPELLLSNVRTTSAYSNNSITAQVAESLIGTAEGTDLVLTFSGIKLDSRNPNTISSNTAFTTTAATAFKNAYGTENSIFSQSTLLNTLKSDVSLKAVYNYSCDNDWGTGNRNVTYGKEVTNSVQYAGKEMRYFDQTKHYTNPLSDSNTPFDFSVGFVPYVYNGENWTYDESVVDANGFTLQEIKVNVSNTTIIEGCGTYNHPYVITDGAQLAVIAEIMKTPEDTAVFPDSIRLPKTPTSYDEISEYASGNRWCTSKTDCAEYTWSGSSWTSATSGAAAWTAEQVGTYLTGAYIQIGNSASQAITLPMTYKGLGGTSANQAFRGVIVGYNNANATISNPSGKPLIDVTNGCVVKNITVNVTGNVSLEQTLKDSENAYFYYDSKCAYYGGIIGEIMGGDNIIDNSYVTLASGNKVTLTGSNGMLCPVGSYVGVVVFGALIFKNMTANTVKTNAQGLVVNYGSDATNLVLESSKGALYVNPLVGRVINGYAVNETNGTFSVTENGHYHDAENGTRTGVQHLLKNNRKHYTIADIDSSESSLLSFGKAATDDNNISYIADAVPTDTTNGIINVPNSQALFIMSLITQSTAGTAQTADGGYVNSLSYGTNSSNVYGMSHNANYTSVGADNIDTNNADYKLTNDDTCENTSVPYIIKRYTTGISNKTITERYTDIETYTITDEIEESYQSGDTYTGTADEFISVDKNGDDIGFYLYIKTSSNYNYMKNKTLTGGDSFKIERSKSSNQSTAKARASVYYFEKVDTKKYRIYTYDNNDKIYMCMMPHSNESNNQQGDMSFTNTATLATVFDITNHNKDANCFYISYQNIGLNAFSGDGGNGIAGWKAPDDTGAKVTIEFAQDTAVIKTISHEETRDVEKTREVIITGGYPARCLTSTLGYYDINLTSGVDYVLPDSFRGIGSVGNQNNCYAMQVDVFDGKGCTIDEDIYLNRYGNTSDLDNYFDQYHCDTDQDYHDSRTGYTATASDSNKGQAHGIGMYDSVLMKGENSKFYNFTLSGSVNTENYNLSTTPSGTEIKGVNHSKLHWLSTGGVCGWSTYGHWCNFENIHLTDLSVRGATQAAGLIAMAGLEDDIVRQVTVTGCWADEISLEITASYDSENRNVMGALVGKCSEGKVVIDGGSSGKTVTIKSMKSAMNTNRVVAGGIVAYAGNGCEVTNMKVCPAASLNGQSVTIGNTNIAMAGGIVGLMQPAVGGSSTCRAIFRDCEVENINVSGNYAGGFYGGAFNNNYCPFSITIDNCQMTGDPNKNTIQGKTYAGGFVAHGRIVREENGLPNIVIQNSSIENYVIASSNNNSHSGGFIGYANAHDGNSSVICYVHDSFIENSTLGGSSSYAGGVIGKIEQNNNNKILGYNVELKNITPGNNTKIGAWVGEATTDTNTKKTSIQLTGMAIYGTGFEKNIGNGAEIGTASFVFADYDGTCESNQTHHISPFNYSEAAHVEMPLSPYVTVNPFASLGTNTYLTGDGTKVLGDAVSDYSSYTSGKTMAAKLLADLTDANNNRRYTTFQNTAIAKSGGGSNTFESYFKQTAGSNGNRISTYWLEKGITDSDNVGYDDFPVLVIANQDTTETTNLINRYIQLLTNTATNYTADSDYYNIVVNSCIYDDNNDKFVLGTSADAGLTFASHQFALNATGIDSLAKNKFTLIDVQFLDPLTAGTATEKIAYHLYVPIYTVKTLNARFISTVASGTNYKESEYNLSSGKNNLVMESFDNWITARFRYTYSASDIQVLVNSRMLDWNSDKEIVLEFDNSATGRSLSNNTELVLIDANGGADRAFYAQGSELNAAVTDAHNISHQSINLSKFHAAYTGGTEFSEQHFCDLIGDIVTVDTTAGTGKYITSTSADYDIKVGDNYYKFDPNTTSGYQITVNSDYTEDYYLSIRMPTDEYVYVFNVLSSGELDGLMKTYVTNSYFGTLLFGDLYEQELSSVSVLSTDHTQLITETNKKITINVTSKINLKDTNTSYYATKLSTNNIAVYHSNLINLNKHEVDGTVNNIINGTNVNHITREYTISSQSDKNGALAAVTSNEDVELKPSYINAKSEIPENELEIPTTFGIQPYLINVVNGAYPGAEITQTIEIEFFDIQSEFPECTADQTDIGVNVLVFSNLSYVEESLPYSSKRDNYQDGQYFYIEDTNSATLRLKADQDIQYDLFDVWGNYSYNESLLGINGYSSTQTYNWKSPYTGMPVSATAIYNTSGISNFSDAKQVKYILQLYKKTDVEENGAISIVEYRKVDIANYLNNVKLTGGSILTKDTEQSDVSEYVYIEDIYDTADPPEIIANMSDQIFTAKLDFEVKTGGDFKDYANYQVLLIAELLDTNGNVISNSLKRDFIVYTNAKIHPEFLVPSSTP